MEDVGGPGPSPGDDERGGGQTDVSAGTPQDAAGESGGRTLRLSVPEMDCSSCASKVDSALERVEGIVDTTLSPTSGTATVTYDPAETNERAVVNAVESAGYSVEGGADGAVSDGQGGQSDPGGAVDVAPPAEVWTSPRGIKTWVGAAFLTAGLLFAFVLTGSNVEVATVLDYPLDLTDALFVVAIAVSGYPVVRGGYYSARNRSLDIDLLMGVAIVAASAIGYFVEAATLAVLFSIAELMETYAMDQARDSLRELVELAPDEATVVTGDETETRPVESVSVGDVVAVSPGEKVPLDGVVVEGSSAVDESPITGESVPVDKMPGDEVYAGSIAAEGYLEVEVTATAGDSTLSRIIELVQGAEAERTETEQFVDRFAGYYTPVVVAFAILTAAVPPLALGWDAGTWFVRGLTLLVIACPCAFVISTPVSVVSGITSAARNGVLIKGGIHLESMGRVDAVAFDKTGTLTKGNLTVTDVVPTDGHDESRLLEVAAALERRSEHPIGDAVLARADKAGVEDLPVSDFESLPGKGVRAAVDGETYYAGKPGLFENFDGGLSGEAVTDGGSDADRRTDGGVAESVTGLDDTVADLAADGKTVVLVGTETDVLGAIAIADEVRPAARRTVARLHELGIERVVMLTGDNEETARAVAEQVGVDEYKAELLPEEKVEAIAELSESGQVAMVGDGINDAPALAAADVGIAMGAAGTDTAIETADVALMGDDLAKVPYLYSLSHTANGVIQQNVWASLAVKALLAVGVPLGYVTVAVAVVVGDMGMSLGVTGNAMRLSGVKPENFDE